MPDLPLTFALGTTERFHPITDGDVRPEGIDLRSSVERRAVFWAMPHTEPLDVSEMSLTGYLWAIQHGHRWVGIPVFPGWVFSCHADRWSTWRGHRAPEDLRGQARRRARVPGHRHRLDRGVPGSRRTACAPRTSPGARSAPQTPATIARSATRRPPACPSRPSPKRPAWPTCSSRAELDAVTRYFGGPGRGKANGITIDRSYMTLKDLAASDRSDGSTRTEGSSARVVQAHWLAPADPHGSDQARGRGPASMGYQEPLRRLRGGGTPH